MQILVPVIQVHGGTQDVIQEGYTTGYSEKPAIHTQSLPTNYLLLLEMQEVQIVFALQVPHF